MDLTGLTNVLKSIVVEVVGSIMRIIDATVGSLFEGDIRNNYFNIYLFSEIGWFNEPISVFEAVLWVITVFVTFFVIKIVYRFFAKLIKKLFGVIRL